MAIFYYQSMCDRVEEYKYKGMKYSTGECLSDIYRLNDIRVTEHDLIDSSNRIEFYRNKIDSLKRKQKSINTRDVVDELLEYKYIYEELVKTCDRLDRQHEINNLLIKYYGKKKENHQNS